jgi:hypothetical protein
MADHADSLLCALESAGSTGATNHDVCTADMLVSTKPFAGSNLNGGQQPIAGPIDNRWSSRIETTHAVFDREIAAEQADALLCLWGPSEELFTFPRRRAWYCCEPACQFRAQEDGAWLRLKDRLRPEEFLWHGHLDVRFRVPHQTHYEPLQMNCRSDRKDKAIAVVSNYGGNPLKAHPDIRFRNHLITSPLVDLFGRASWRRYRPHWYSWPGTPPNYQGELPGDWSGQQKRELLSQYKVCVCLENMNEPG